VGVPVLVKDACLQIEGTPYYIGTRLLRDLGHRSKRTTEFARRLRDAGFVVLGKTNVAALVDTIEHAVPDQRPVSFVVTPLAG
jgi:Asp-tRNA(Asn)/Glu-tRNA(Gln) amidotransferase A subunit family amidase